MIYDIYRIDSRQRKSGSMWQNFNSRNTILCLPWILHPPPPPPPKPNSKIYITNKIDVVQTSFYTYCQVWIRTWLSTRPHNIPICVFLWQSYCHTSYLVHCVSFVACDTQIHSKVALIWLKKTNQPRTKIQCHTFSSPKLTFQLNEFT